MRGSEPRRLKRGSQTLRCRSRGSGTPDRSRLKHHKVSVTRTRRPGSIVRTTFQATHTRMGIVYVQKTTLYVRDAALAENGSGTRTSISRAGREVLLQCLMLRAQSQSTLLWREVSNKSVPFKRSRALLRLVTQGIFCDGETSEELDGNVQVA